MTKQCIFILTNGEWELGDWALYIRSTPETAHFLCGWWVDFADVYFFITTIGELLHFLFMLLYYDSHGQMCMCWPALYFPFLIRLLSYILISLQIYACLKMMEWKKFNC